MSTATVTSKGQITIPADVRQALQLKAGDRVEFVQIEPGRFEVVAATRPVTDLKDLFGRPRSLLRIDHPKPLQIRPQIRQDPSDSKRSGR